MTILYNWCVLEVSCVCRMTRQHELKFFFRSIKILNWNPNRTHLREKKTQFWNSAVFGFLIRSEVFCRNFCFNYFLFRESIDPEKLVIGSDRKFDRNVVFGFVSIFCEILNPFSNNGFRRKIKQGSNWANFAAGKNNFVLGAKPTTRMST